MIAGEIEPLPEADPVVRLPAPRPGLLDRLISWWRRG